MSIVTRATRAPSWGTLDRDSTGRATAPQRGTATAGLSIYRVQRADGLLLGYDPQTGDPLWTDDITAAWAWLIDWDAAVAATKSLRCDWMVRGVTVPLVQA